MKLLFENWRSFINEQASMVRTEYERMYPSSVLPASEKSRIRKDIIRKFKKIQKETQKSLRKGAKRKQYIKKFGASRYKKALPTILKNVKNSEIKVVLGWDSPVVPEDQKEDFFMEILNKGRRFSGALLKKLPGGSHRVIVLADLLIKRGTLESYLETTFYHEFVGHVVPETFEQVTGINVSKEQSMDIQKIIKPECIRMARRQAHVSVQGVDPEIGAMKEINAWLVAMTAKGFTESDYKALCKDRATAKSMSAFKKTDSFKKYGSGAWCILCDDDSKGIVDAVNNIAKITPDDSVKIA